MIPPCLTLSIIRYVSRVKWSNPGKGIAPSPILRCSSYWKRSLQVALNYGHQLYLITLYIYIYIYIYIYKISKPYPERKAIAKHFSDSNTLPLLEKLIKISALFLFRWSPYKGEGFMTNVKSAWGFLNNPHI